MCVRERERERVRSQVSGALEREGLWGRQGGGGCNSEKRTGRTAPFPPNQPFPGRARAQGLKESPGTSPQVPL